MKKNAERYSICQVAVKLFTKFGFEHVTMAEICSAVKLSESAVFTHFGDKSDIVLYFFQCINNDWEIGLFPLEKLSIQQRFEEFVEKKIQLLSHYLNFFSAAEELFFTHTEVGVSTNRTSFIRTQGLSIMHKLIGDAADPQFLLEKYPKLPELLFLIHWSVLFIYIQTGDKDKAIASITFAFTLLNNSKDLDTFLDQNPFFQSLDEKAGGILSNSSEKEEVLITEILKIVFAHRKVSDDLSSCKSGECKECYSLHTSKMYYFIERNLPIEFVLPAFPAKSPNRSKVLGKLPDLGEQIALTALNDMCKEICTIYPPGAKIVIASDGRIFSELVNVSDTDISNYVLELKQMISTLELNCLDVVNLEDLVPQNSFALQREKLIHAYAEDLKDLKNRRSKDPDFKQLFNGIHRFVVEDTLSLELNKSKTKIKNEAKEVALKIIQHSNAWTRFLAHVYPTAVRLSIHPYPAHDTKIGINITKSEDNWLTPWHGTIVLTKDGYILVKKHAAIAMQAKLVIENGRPSHYTTIV